MSILLKLEEITGVSDWESINFGILPGEDPKGYLFPLSVEANNPSRQIVSYAVGIAISSDTLTGLSEASLDLANQIVKAFSQEPQCFLDDSGNSKSLRLTTGVEIEIPQTYPNQSNISLTTGFFTALTFTIEAG